MKRIFSLLLLSLLLQTAGARKMRDVFAAMPDSVLGLMTKNNRLDCIDFIENNMEARVRNRLDGYTVLRTLTDDYLDLQLTLSCRVEMKLLPQADTLSLICLVRTYSVPAAESDISFYTLDWTPVPKSRLLSMPAYAAFWAGNDTTDAAEVERLQHLQDMHFVAAELSADDLSLTFRLQPGPVDKDTAGRMEAVLRPVTCVWRGGRFVPAATPDRSAE